ncbi:MAG: hypothetical protein RMY64_32650 [Nostoc sp. DedQUE08]|uniref:hypothetical protein n=1 Tax=unclassified Nostoc TaxID=2593658 RepID=UPI002AD442CF|nr:MULTISPECIES: hypothetical protein [unclassified Nostoc]MDZ8033013.1 hypothetical protein [Nostoc sp. DedSLP04]MDZ8070306.1 hypothetical protein [Nostoc sp. DedQUE08]MDZ8127329.1 hypothetical protein [Nostoc sp. DedQUE07]MDZ8137234.1 hypothetical protein [Nostoc sp. DedQUE04]
MKTNNTVWVLCRCGPVSNIEGERSQMFEQCKLNTLTVWSFCRFLHLVITKGRLNSLSERSEVINVLCFLDYNLILTLQSS